MTPELISVVIFGSLLVLMAMGVPVAFALLGVAAAGFLIFVGPSATYAMFSVTFSAITKDIFIAIPLYIFMAAILEFSGLAADLYDMMHKWMAGFRGGLAIATIMICTIIAAMSGIAATGTVTMGLIAYPEMMKRHYNKGIAIGTIVAGGALGPLVPPSVTMIIVGGFAYVSVGKLFMGGLIPGLMCSALWIAYVGIRCWRKPELGPPLAPEERVGWRVKLVSLRATVLPIILIMVVLGGIYAGIYTPTEAGGIGAAGALIISAIHRNLSRETMKKAVITTLRVTAMCCWLLIGGVCYASLIGITGVTHAVGGLLSGLAIGTIGILIIMLLIVFILGMFIDAVPIIMICLPVFVPVVTQMGIDLLWFCLLFTMCVVVGLITPPFSMNAFYFKGLGHPDVSLMDIYSCIWPYVCMMLIVLILSFVFPPILVWLPNSMIK